MSKAPRFTLQDLQNKPCSILNPHIFQEQPQVKQKKSKYGNKKTVVDGITFDSIKEAERFKELKLLLKAGAIGMLERQVPFELNIGGTHSLKYVADFTYIDAKTGETIVEDVKSAGTITAIYKKKRRLMKKIYGIFIKEVL